MSTESRPGGDGGAGPDTERDAWLREALRHAPDAQAGAPSSVRDAILRQAREATASAATAPRPRRSGAGRQAPWVSVWSWLMQPTVATGFAGVMVATLVGVMWWGRPIDEPLREAGRPDVAAPSERAAAAAARSEGPAVVSPQAPAVGMTVPAPAPKAAEESRREIADRVAARKGPAADAADMAVARKTAPTGAGSTPADNRAVEKARRVAPEAALELERSRDAMLAKSAPPAAAPAPTVAGATNAAPASPPPAPSPANPPAAAVAAAPAAERKREQQAIAEAPRAAAKPGTQVAEADAPAAMPPEVGPAQSAAPPAPAVTRRFEARGAAGVAADRPASATLSLVPGAAPEALARVVPVESPVARLRAAVAVEPGAWTWQRGGGAEQPMNDAVQAWLGRLDDAAHSRWQLSAAPASTAIAAPLRLLRNGRLHTTVRIEAGAVRVDGAGDSAGLAGAATAGGATGAIGGPRAVLPAALAASLKAALEQAAP